MGLRALDPSCPQRSTFRLSIPWPRAHEHERAVTPGAGKLCRAAYVQYLGSCLRGQGISRASAAQSSLEAIQSMMRRLNPPWILTDKPVLTHTSCLQREKA